MGGAEKDVDAPTGEMQGKSDERMEELNASIPELVKETEEPTKKCTSKKLRKRTSGKSSKCPRSLERQQKYSRRLKDANDNDIKKGGKNRLPAEGTSQFFARDTQQKGNTNNVRLPEISHEISHPASDVRRRASSSSGIPATSPSLIATKPMASSTPSILALLRRSSLPGHSLRSASSSSPARASATSTWPSAGGIQRPFGEGTSRERQLPHGGLSSHDIESGSLRESTYAHSLDHARSQQRFAIPHASLFEVNLVTAGLLIDGLLWQVKDAVRYVLIFLFVLGFLGFLVGESIRSSRIRGTGSVATVFAFLITMLLLVIHKS